MGTPHQRLFSEAIIVAGTCAVIACATAGSAGQELPAGVKRVALFRPGDGGYPTFRMEALTITPRGTILAFTEGRKGGSGVHGDVDLLLRRSLDGGKTWGPMQVAVDNGPDTVCYPTPLVDRETNRIWLAMCMYKAPANQGTIVRREPPDTCHTWITFSDDDGAHWKPPIEITQHVKPPGTTWFAPGAGFGIQVVGGSGVQLVKNTISGVASDCIEFDSGANSVIAGNKVTGCGVNGIDVTSTGSVVEKNKITAPVADGLVLRGAEVALKNKIAATGDDGIAVSGTVTATGNKISGVGDDGLQVDGNGGTYTANKINGASSDGIQTNGTNNTFSGNKVSGAADDCVEIGIAGSGTFTGNKLSNCEEGFQVDGAGNQLLQNKVSRILDNGFDILSDGNTITGNKVTSSSDGFVVSGAGNVFSMNASKAPDEDLHDFDATMTLNTYDGTNSFRTKKFGPPGL